MKKFIYLFVNVIIVALLASCAKDIVDVNGSILGIVKDSDDGHLLQNCSVTLSPSGKTCITSTDGQFNFEDLEPGSYTLSVTKTGYNDFTKTINVISGQSSDASVMLKSKGPFAASSSSLDFGDLSTSLPLTLANNSDVLTSFEIKNVPSWAKCSQLSGSISPQSSLTINVNIDRESVNYGTFTQSVQIAYTGSKQGNVSVTLNMKKVKLTAPTVEIASNATEITQNGFKIAGKLTATGGAEVTNYGHCWSLSHNPTVDDAHTSNGKTVEINDFSSTLTNLTVGTTYYVRAYATNSQGTSYSNEIVVETQDVASNKWDGNIAKAFDGGSGTAGDPYKIANGGQLLLIKNYTDKNFILVSNIDLDNKNWMPISDFKGVLDGAGYTISNLNINRTDNNLGLFARIMNNATVKDLNIKGVKINAGSSDYVGALAGQISGDKLNISNVNVTLTTNSIILGHDYVGGVIGYYGAYGTSNPKILNCHVASQSTDYVIKGNNYVGGVCGELRNNSSVGMLTLEKCTANVSVKGGDYVGGILGYSYATGEQVASCGFKGKVSGSKYVGGIAGACDDIIACKADADMTASDYVAGICGYCGAAAKITACYSSGSIDCSSSHKSGIGAGAYKPNVKLCYTTMPDGLSNESCQDCATTSAKGSGTNTAANCTNITQHLKDAFSEYASYYKFDKTWVWEGLVKGKTVKVSCPQLAWE